MHAHGRGGRRVPLLLADLSLQKYEKMKKDSYGCTPVRDPKRTERKIQALLCCAAEQRSRALSLCAIVRCNHTMAAEHEAAPLLSGGEADDEARRATTSASSSSSSTTTTVSGGSGSTKPLVLRASSGSSPSANKKTPTWRVLLGAAYMCAVSTKTPYLYKNHLSVGAAYFFFAL